MKSTCPSPEALTAYVQGKLTTDGLGDVAAHARDCQDCRDRLARIGLAGDPRGPVALDTTVDQPTLIRMASATGSHVEGAKTGEQADEDEWREALTPAEREDEIGRLGSYRVLKVLGRGGMGIVYQAEDPKLQRLVALKVMRPRLIANETSRSRFLREARAAAAITHDHIVTIHHVGEDRGIPYVAMQLLEGEPLDAYLKGQGERRLPLDEILRLGMEMADGLAAAHERGLMHRDIKPANIWLEGERRRVKILDFGLARGVHDELRITQTGFVVGTPAYMAPEQVNARALGPTCDLFSLGSVLYRLCTGIEPFKRATVFETLRAVTQDEPAPLGPELGLPSAFVALIGKMLSKDSARRPAAVEVRGSIQAIRESRRAAAARRAASAEITEAIPVDDEPPAATAPRTARKPWSLIGWGIAFGLLAGGIWFFKTRPHSTPVAKPGSVENADEKRAAVPNPAQIDQRFIVSVSRMGPRQQVGAVKEKLRELNPEFDGELWQAFDPDTGTVKRITINTDQVSIIWPVRAFPEMATLFCSGSAPGKGRLHDLEALRGLKLRLLDCRNNAIVDLAPLKDLSHLEFFKCDVEAVIRQADLLKSISTIRRINEKPAAEFWHNLGISGRPKS